MVASAAFCTRRPQPSVPSSRLQRPTSQPRLRCRAFRIALAARRRAPTARLFVPGDTFGGLSPEERAAKNLVLVCTAVAVRVVLAQLGPGGEGGDLPPTPAFAFLSEHLAQHPLGAQHPDDWLEGLMAQPQHGQLLGVRILEVRAAYCADDFDWQQARRLTGQAIQEANVRLLRRHAARAFGGALDGGSEEEPQGS